MNSKKTLNINKIVTSFFLATALFFTTAFVNEGAIAAIPSSNFFAVGNNSETTYPTDDKNIDGLLYSNSNKVKSLNSVDDFVSPQRQKELLDATQIPARKQPAIDRSNPDNKLLEKIKQMFQDAGNF